MQIRTMMVVGIAALAMAACADGVPGNLWPAGNFEGESPSWTLPTNGFWSVRAGEGRGGSRALVIEQPKKTPYMWPTFGKFKVEPTTAYRYFMWVKKDSYDAPRGRIYVSFTWFDANGRELGGGEGFPTDDNAVDGWACYEGKTGPLPRNAALGSFSVWMSQGVNGRMRFDDFAVVALPSKPAVSKVISSAYQDRQEKGTARFVAEYVVNPEKYPDSQLDGKFEYVAKDGGRRSVAATLTDGYAQGTVDVTDLAVGTNSIAFVLRAKAVELARAAMDFERTSAPPTRKVYIDASGRTIVDGKPFFPLGMFWLGVTEKAIMKYKEGPFNCLMPYNGPERDMLDVCHREGLKVITAMKSGWKNANDPVKEEKYVQEMMRFRDHPSTLAWYICDELPTSLAPLLVKRHRRVREIDPEHPTWIVLDKPKYTRDYLGGFDVIANDPYPLGYHKAGLENLCRVSQNPELMRERSFGMRPLWQVPQTFNWGYYFPDECGHPNVRRPSFEEMRSMTWQAIAAGANGLVYYSWFDIWKEKDAAKAERHWRDVVAVANEVKAWESVLLAEDVPLALDAESAKDIVARAYRRDGVDYLLVANRHARPVVARVTPPGRERMEVKLDGLGYFIRKL